jgi:hypothetical protein
VVELELDVGEDLPEPVWLERELPGVPHPVEVVRRVLLSGRRWTSRSRGRLPRRRRP